MAEYVYPAVFHLNADDGSYTITFPDLWRDGGGPIPRFTSLGASPKESLWRMRCIWLVML